MNLLIYILVLIATLYFWYQKKLGHRNKLLAKFPAVKSYPILGHFPHFFGKKPWEIFELFDNFHRQCGPVYRFDLNPFLSSIVVADPVIIEQILTSQKLIDKASEYDLLSEWLAEGLITSTGNKWFQRRRIITPAFHFKILEQFTEIMDKHANGFVKKLNRMSGRKVDVFAMSSLYTLDVICEASMGYNLKAQEDETSEYVKYIKEASEIVFQRIFDFKKRIEILYKFTSMYQREKVVIQKIQDFVHSVIVNRQKYWQDRNLQEENEEDEFGIKKKTAFLDLLLKTRIDGQPLSESDIREEVNTFMFAGHDTTATAVSFVLLNIAKNPKIQDLIYEECVDIFGGDDDRVLTIQHLNQMNYLEKVIKESLRLYPSVPRISRKFREDVKLGDYLFPANVSIRLSPYEMGRNPELFPDPLKFDPLRFDDENSIRLFSFVPFSAGPRNCIGQKFAMLEIKSIISKMVRNFRIHADKEDMEPRVAHEIILRPTDGILLTFKPREVNL